MLVLAVLEWLGEESGERDLVRKAVAAGAPEVRGDPRVIRRRVRERLGREPAPRALIERPLAQRGEDLLVPLRPDDDHDRIVVLGRRADHRRPADVDLLDGLVQRGPRARHGADERVQVDAHEVDLPEPVLGESRNVLGAVAPGEDPGVHGGMESLDPAVHHFREAC